MTRMRRTRKLQLEALEPREVPAIFGIPWANAENLTISFAPDGTKIAGYSQSEIEQDSKLFNELNSGGNSSTWQIEILRAFQTWAVQSNINIGLVSDSGNPFGPEGLSSGTVQGGDFRVGALSLSPDVIAISQPYNPLSGTWAGDILVNTTKDFTTSAQSGRYDVFSTFLHEASNALGLGDSTDPTSVRYGSYNGIRTTLNAADIAAIQGLYGGVRKADLYDAVVSNGTSATASILIPTLGNAGSSGSRYGATVRGDLTTQSDVDWYTYTPVAGTEMSFRFQTQGLSLLSGRISVYNQSGTLLHTVSQSSPLAASDLAFTLSGATSYRIKIEKARSDVFGIGTYLLKIGENYEPSSSLPSTTTVQMLGQDGNTNDSLGTATPLQPFIEAGNLVYRARAEINSTDRDYYQIVVPSTSSPSMTVVIQPPTSYTVFAKVTVLDASGQTVAAEILSNGDGGRYVVQVANPKPFGVYFLLVESVGMKGSYLAGEYEVRVDFTTPVVERTTVLQGSLNNATRKDHLTLDVGEARVYHFSLDAESGSSVSSGVRMTIFDSNGKVVGRLTARAGETVTGTFLLKAGTYYIRVEGVTSATALPTLNFRLRGIVISDPIDPYLPADPTDPPLPPPDFDTSDDGDPYYETLELTDPNPDPWIP
jgi:hypothetical protein